MHTYRQNILYLSKDNASYRNPHSNSNIFNPKTTLKRQISSGALFARASIFSSFCPISYHLCFLIVFILNPIMAILLMKVYNMTAPSKQWKTYYENMLWSFKGKSFKQTQTNRNLRSKVRIKISPREASSYLLLRRKGYSVNMIARAFGRSTSVVWHRLMFNVCLASISFQDMRKLPNHVRQLCASRLRRSMNFYLPLWERWISGEGDKPP